jgi:NADH:ubiquinone oxidoreductase subunit H
MLKRYSTIALSLLLFLPAFAGNSLGELVRQSHKYYVSIAVLFIILTGIFIFLIYLERKISALEKKFKK